MADGTHLFILTVAGLLFAAMCFAAMETAFASVSQARIRALAGKGGKKALQAQYVLEHIDRAITSILICTNIVHLTAASVVTVYVTNRFGEAAVTISTLLTTLAVFLFGEMLPKSVARKYSSRIALQTGGFVCAIMKIFAPASAALSKIGQAAVALTKGDPETSVTETELKDIIEDMTEEGALAEEQGDLISSALQFGNVTAESILTSRVDLDALEISAPPEEILDRISASGHSRLPVYEETIDHIVGIVQIRRYLKHFLSDEEPAKLKDLLDEPFFVHQSTKIDNLLTEMTERKIQMAVVTDNFGGTLGIVTVEDILEELVGEIWDEDDVVEETVVDLGGGRYLVDAEESVSDVFETLGFEDPEENEALVNTLMGEWAYEQFAAIPKVGDSFDYHDLRVSVSEMEHNRILKLEVWRLPEGTERAEGGDGE